MARAREAQDEAQGRAMACPSKRARTQAVQAGVLVLPDLPLSVLASFLGPEDLLALCAGSAWLMEAVSEHVTSLCVSVPARSEPHLATSTVASLLSRYPLADLTVADPRCLPGLACALLSGRCATLRSLQLLPCSEDDTEARVLASAIKDINALLTQCPQEKTSPTTKLCPSLLCLPPPSDPPLNLHLLSLAFASPQAPKLSSLSLRHCGLGGLSRLLSTPGCSALSELSVEARCLSEVEVTAVSRLLASAPVRSLRLVSYVDTEAHVAAPLLEALAAEGALARLEVFTLEGCAVGSRGPALLSRAMARGSLTGLRSLTLARAGLSAEDVGVIARNLRHAPRIKALDFVGNDGMGEGGVDALADALESGACAGLRALHLDVCGLGDGGIASLASAWLNGAACASTLETVDLFDNSISDTGAQLLASALPRLSNLRALDLRDNDIGVWGVAAMCVASQGLHLRVM